MRRRVACPSANSWTQRWRMRAVLACPLRRVPGLAVGDSVQHAGRRPSLLLRKCTCMTGGWLLLPLLLLLLGLPGQACCAECAGRQAQAGVTTPHQLWHLRPPCRPC